MPWEHASCTLYQIINIDANHGSHTGTPWRIENSGEFELVIWRTNPKIQYPIRELAENGFYVVGLTGIIRGTGTDRIKWEIRYDWDPTKRYHVNLHVTTDATTLYSFNSYTFGLQQTEQSFKEFLRWARSTTLISKCYDPSPSSEDEEDEKTSWLYKNKLTPVVRMDVTTKKQCAQAVWEGLFGEGKCVEHNWKRFNERLPPAEFHPPSKSVIRFDEPRDRSVEPGAREFWQELVGFYLRVHHELYRLALIS